MKKTVLLALTLLSFNSQASEFKIATGMGNQYGGLVGVQFASQDDDSKYFASLGLAGVSLGFQHRFENNPTWSYGLSAGVEGLFASEGFAFANVDYHAGGFNKSGWTTGLALGYMRDDGGKFPFSDNDGVETRPVILLNLGYQF